MLQFSKKSTPVMANEFERSPRCTGQNAATLGFRGSSGVSAAAFFLNPNYVNLQNVSGGDDEVGNWANGLGLGPVGVEIVGLNGRNLGAKVGATMSDESGGAVLDARGRVHHLVGCETHTYRDRDRDRDRERNGIAGDDDERDRERKD
ncbi:hypothetical protein CsSME_00001552 [Camellia sinensis var. sinensis]